MSRVRRAAHATGAARGVGLRPHVDRAAVRHGVDGCVRDGVGSLWLQSAVAIR